MSKSINIYLNTNLKFNSKLLYPKVDFDTECIGYIASDKPVDSKYKVTLLPINDNIKQFYIKESDLDKVYILD